MNRMSMWFLGAILVTNVAGNVAQAALFTGYAASVPDPGNSFWLTSQVIDLPDSAFGYLATVSAGVTLISFDDGGTFSVFRHAGGLQVVQGCAQRSAFCGLCDWQTIAGFALFTHGYKTFVEGTGVASQSIGDFLIPDGVQSLRLVVAGTISRGDFATISGSLRVTPIPEPAIWVMFAAGLLTVGLIARRGGSGRR